VGLLGLLFGFGRKPQPNDSDEDVKGWVHPRDLTDPDEWENTKRWEGERSKDP
jgi:hypothetical protein